MTTRVDIKKLRLRLLSLAMLCLSAGVYAQTFAPTRFPHQGPQYVDTNPMTQNWLYSGANTATGDYTGANVVFFSVPDTTTQTLYFAVRNPDVDADATLANSEPDLSVVAGPPWVNYTLIGGTGAYSSAAGRHLTYANANAGGTVLDTITGSSYTGVFRVGNWVYFNGVSPKQGEHIGNRYYFRLTAVTPGYGTQEFKHCYQFDVSLANSGTPTGLSTGYAFSYDVTFAQLSAAVSTAETWDFYPFVPHGSGSPMTATTNAFNYAGSGTIVVNAWNDNLGVSQGVAGFPMGSGTATNTYTVSSAQTNATWHLQIATTGNLGGRASGAAELYFSIGGTLLPIYTTSYSGPAPDHFALSPSSSTGITGSSLSYRAQLVDASGNPLSYIAAVKVTASGSALINGVSGTQTLTTDTTGGANFTVSDATAETVSLSLTSDGTGGTTSLPGIDGSASATFTTNPNPTMSSAIDLTFAQGSTANQPVITISANGGTWLTTNGIKIQIPSSLSANFSTTPPNALLTAGTGTLGTPTVSGNVVTIPITAALSSNAVVTVGSITPISYTSTNSASTGYLQLSYDGGATYPVSDNKIVVVQAPIYTWNGSASTAWNNGSNWTPTIAGGPPTTANVRISSATQYPIVTATTGNGGGSTITVNNLFIDSGASLTLNGATAIAVNGAFSNSGTFTLNGNESVNLTNSTATGTVVYAGSGSYSGLAMGTSYYNLTVSSGTYTLSSDITVNGTITLAGGSLSAGSQTINLYGNWTDSGGTFTAGSSTLQLLGTSTSVISGAIAPNGFNAFTCSAAGKSIQFATGTTQALGVLAIAGSASSTISLAGTSAATWTIDVTSSSVSYANIAYSTVSPGQTAYYSTNSGNNSGWTFQSFKAWTGAAGTTSWNTAGNWSPAGVPASTDNVTINPAAFQPVLDVAASFASLTIASGATLDLAGYGVTRTTAGSIAVNGTLKLQGGETLSNVSGITGTGTVQLYGTAGPYTVPSFSYYALAISGSGTFALANPLTVANAFTVSSGTLAAGANSITVGGNFNLTGIAAYSGSGLVTMNPSSTATLRSGGQTLTALTVSSGSVSLGAPLTLSSNLSISSGATLNAAGATIGVAGTWSNSGTFNSGTGTVSLTSTTSQQVLGSTSFNNLSCTVAGQTIQFAAGATQTITGTFTVTGTPAGMIKLVSTSSGSQWLISAAASSITYAWVQDSGVTGGANIGTTADKSHDNGNNTTSPPTTPGWVFPSASSISWTGGTSTSWNVGSNWSSGYVPNPGDTVTVSNVGAQPATLTGNVTVASLTVGSGASIGLAGSALTVTGSASLGGTIGNSSATTAGFTVSAGGSTTLTNAASISGGGNPIAISLGGTVNGGFGLALNAGSSTVSIAGPVGGTSPLASLSVSSTNGAANAITIQSATTSGTQGYTGNVTLGANAAMTTTNSAVTFSAGVNGTSTGAQGLAVSAGSGLVSFGGAVGGSTSLASVAVSSSAAAANAITIQSVTTSGTQGYTGNVTLGASATLTTTANAITFGAALDAQTPGAESLTIGAGTGTVTPGGAIGGTTPIGSLTLNGGTLALGSETLSLEGDWTNNAGASGFSAGSSTVNFVGGGAPFLASGGSPFNKLTISGGTAVIVETNPLTVSGQLTVSSSADSINLQNRPFTIGTLSFGAAGSLGTFAFDGTQAGSSTIASYTPNAGVIELTGSTSTSAFPGTLPTTFYNLTINGLTTSTTYTLNKDITIDGTLTIQGGVLDVSSSNHGITVAGTWQNNVGVSGFIPESGTVTFLGGTNAYTVNGNNNFFNFVCTVPAATITFGPLFTQTILPGGNFHVAGGSGSPIRLQATPAHTLGIYWVFDVDPGATLTMSYVTVYDSNASAYPISAQVNVTVGIGSPYNDVGWYLPDSVTASQTADSNGDGKIDAILVTVSANLQASPDFSGFAATVSGYTVTGYAPGPSPSQFYINLAEGPALDTDATPTWTILANTTLVSAVGSQIVGPKNVPQTPTDGAAPIIGYTLAVAGKSQVFVAFSEPVVQAGGGALTPGNFSIPGYTVSSITQVTASGAGTKEVLLNLSGPVAATDEINQTSLSMVGSFTDMSSAANALAVTTHRISDIGLGLPGQGIVEPIWAKDQSQMNPLLGGTGIIHTFDGSAWLQAQTITMQSYITDAYTLAGSLTVGVYFDSGVSSSLKSAELWLPPFNATQYDGIVPYADAAAQAVSAALDTPNPHIRDAVIASTNPLIKSGATIQFFFEISGADPLICASLPNPDASNWYRLVQPWSFKLQNIVTQRGEVTILNNVINPNYGQQTNLVYTLTEGGMVTINVFNLAGELVNTLFSGQQSPGQYSTSWSGRNFSGEVVARGIYFIRVVAPGVDEFRKVLVVK